jgi:hypothetical protein
MSFASRPLHRWLLILLGVVLVAGGVLAMSPAMRALADDPPPTDDPVLADTADGGVGTLTTPNPTLTPAQQTGAQNAVTGNTAMQQTLSGKSYTLSAVPWSTLDAATLLGAYVTVTFTTPFSVTNAHWPALVYNGYEQATPPYGVVVRTISATNITKLQVAVAFTNTQLGNQVVGIYVDPDAVVTSEN